MNETTPDTNQHIQIWPTSFLKNANLAVMYKRPPGVDLIPISVQYVHMDHFTFLF